MILHVNSQVNIFQFSSSINYGRQVKYILIKFDKQPPNIIIYYKVKLLT